MAFQYMLLFPFGEVGYKHDVCHRVRAHSHNRKGNRLTKKRCSNFVAFKKAIPSVLSWCLYYGEI
ncbi:hypothetical protein Lal_00031947 [Lupinus albus]|nr:hypothetical protein Lal_00031947 [Lupinus albus]